MGDIIGWFYLHQNGELIYKRELDGGTAADIRESPFARAMWPCDPSDREMAWNVLVQASALGARKGRIDELAAKWGCNDADAEVYAKVVDARLVRDGNSWCATRSDFIDLQTSPVGFGDTALEALGELCKGLGYRGGKTWAPTFRDLLAPRTEAAPGSPS